jgi:hypothetical protein
VAAAISTVAAAWVLMVASLIFKFLYSSFAALFPYGLTRWLPDPNEADGCEVSGSEEVQSNSRPLD